MNVLWFTGKAGKGTPRVEQLKSDKMDGVRLTHSCLFGGSDAREKAVGLDLVGLGNGGNDVLIGREAEEDGSSLVDGSGVAFLNSQESQLICTKIIRLLWECGSPGP